MTDAQPHNDGGSQQGKTGPPPWRRLIRPLLLALGMTLFIFGCGDIIQRLWLGNVPMPVLHLLFQIEGILSSIVVAGTVSWMIIRSSPAFLTQPAMDDADLCRPGVTPLERSKMYAQWFIAMRWIAVLLAAVLVFISVQVFAWLPGTVWRPLMATVAVLAVLNVFYTILARRHGVGPRLLSAQVYVDLVILTVLLQFSGGIENPLSMMMIFHVIIGGILLSRRECYWIAAFASFLFAALAWGEWSDLLTHYTLQLYPHVRQANGELFHPAEQSLYVMSRSVLQGVVMFLTAYFVTTLAERLRQNERRLETLAERATAGQQLLEQSLETTGAGLRVLDGELRGYWDNARWRQWCACPTGPDCASFELLNGSGSPARQTLEDGKIRVTEVVMEPGGGCPPGAAPEQCPGRILQVTTAPLANAQGRVQRIVELAQDVTRQKRAQEQMARAGQLAAVGELAGRVAHEVNNPIAIISTKSRLLLADHRSEMSPKIAQELAKITDYSDRVARIAQGLLSYCRPSPGTRAPLDVRQPIRKSLAMVEQNARNAGVAVLDELPAALPPVSANSNELEQVFLNLFLNALDAMSGGGRLRVSAVVLEGTAGRPRAVAVTVEDSGVGIPPSVRDRIFEPFFTTKQEGRGTGLGLSICLGVVRGHGGEIRVESEPGKGSRFIVQFPADEAGRPKNTDG
ncbi:MAG: hypothetical protein KGR98_08520 [Verrucomicrobia bacterium]|nr:hypothetical protein [Verrucomicrobiota bacterium]MDE3099140.1 hypothetical protein [Verrucomicrobiota bacterium]